MRISFIHMSLLGYGIAKNGTYLIQIKEAALKCINVFYFVCTVGVFNFEGIEFNE